jgi:membrane-associated protein
MQFIHEIIGLLKEFIHIVLHLDLYLNQWITQFGVGIYPLLFLIIFAETGLVVTPFLPGDSLLFALGALTAVDNAFLSLPILMISLLVAAILGDAANYAIGRYFGEKILAKNWRYFNRTHYEKTAQFYAKHGGKTIILARFIPIVRTFAPFVAGMGQMEYKKFFAYNVIGGVVWIFIFLIAGHYFGNLPSVKSNFHIVIVAIIIISFLPVALEYWKATRTKK